MIVVVARAGDGPARSLVEAWRPHGAVLVTPADLTTEGWVVPFGEAGGTFVAEGQRRPTGEVRGALVRLGAVDAGDLHALVEADRGYGAAETTALLAYWLRALGPAVVNRPSPACLAGPPWSAVEWLTRAARLGLPAVTVDGLAEAPAGPLAWATVVDGRVAAGPAPGGAAAAGLGALAEAAGARCFGAGFAAGGEGGQARLARVTLCPPLDDPPARRALAGVLGLPP